MKKPSPRSDVWLITMPFGPLFVPSIGLGLLQAALAQQGCASRTCYFTFRFAELIGQDVYGRINDETPTTDLVGEWLFAQALFPEPSETATARYVDEILRKNTTNGAAAYDEGWPLDESLIEEILTARQQVEPFLAECLEQVRAARPKVVGFTSTFQQNAAALALARHIKAHLPETCIVMGGANCEGAMGDELCRQFSFVDAIVSGEGEQVFPALVQRVLQKQPYGDLPGVFTRRAALPMLGQALSNAAQTEQLDELPFPLYDDFFAQLKASSLQPNGTPWLLMETARGCWWGEKHHCTFCGLNGQGMAYRSKSAPRALAEFKHLTDKHPGHPVSVVDNILNMDYFKNFIPQLAEHNPGVEVFYEIKANLKKDQLRALAAAGVTSVQPGIESLSDQVLQLMDKGVRALQNIQLLKWCKELGIEPQWNLLWGFPGEAAEEYARMAEFIPLLTHLPPPHAEARIRLDRFSPNYDQAEQRGFTRLSPYPAYGHVYRVPAAALNQLAYFFTFDYVVPRADWSYVEPVAEAIAEWRACHHDSTLFWVEKDERLLLWDARPVAQQPFMVLSGARKFALQACDQTRTAREVQQRWQAHSTKRADLRKSLDELVAQGLMLRQQDSYLALPIPSQLAAA